MSVMSRVTSPAGERTGATPGRLGVPWRTVLSLAAVMAYGDGFWMMALRGAVGSIERTQSPFASWLRESTLILPVFVFAVLGALTLALRWFGPVLTARTFAATALMVVAAGTLVGVAQIAVNSAYDYRLQSSLLQLMHITHHSNVKGLVALEQQATLGLQVSAVVYGLALLLVTNLVLVGWVVALRGGRLNAFAGSARSSQVNGVRLLTAAGFFASGAVHAAAIPDHLSEWPAAGLFIAVLAAAELVVAGRLLARR